MRGHGLAAVTAGMLAFAGCVPAAQIRDAAGARDAGVVVDAAADAARLDSAPRDEQHDAAAGDRAAGDGTPADLTATDRPVADASTADTAAAADAGTVDAPGATDTAVADHGLADVPGDAASPVDAFTGDGATDAGADAGGDAGVAGATLQRVGRQLYLGAQPFQHLAMNKFDLFFQFLGEASGRSPVSVTRPAALQAMDDAVAAGVCCLRVAAMPFWPDNATAFVGDRSAYYAALDDMMDEAAARGLGIIPVVWWHAWLVPDLAGAPLHDVFVSGTAAHGLLFDYAAELAGRYRDHPALLFWELTNELNLLADLDFGSRNDASVAVGMGTPAARSAADNFGSAEMATLLGALAAHIKAVDPDHLISPGYSAPRPSAWHLHSSPEWLGADWSADSAEQMRAYVALTHPDPLDLVSVHLYPEGSRLGRDGSDPELLVEFQLAADALDKPLFVGEFGDTDPTVSVLRSANYTRELMLKMLERRVPLALIWVWEFYQFSPTTPSPHSIEPGVDDALIDSYRQIDGWLAAASTARGAPLALVNGGMELDANGNQRVDGWETVWRNGSSTGWSAGRYSSASDSFAGSATLRLDSGSGDPASMAFALSDPVAVGGGEDLVVSAAIRRHLQGDQRMRFSLVEYDGGGSEIRVNTRELADALGWVYRVEHQRVTLQATTRSVRVRLGAGGAESTIVDVDAVRLFAVEP